MIRSFKSKEAAKIWHGNVSHRLPNNIQQIIRRKLRMLNNAKILTDLRIPPNNRLGEFSIRINDQWRICFKWVDGNAYDVTIEDYH